MTEKERKELIGKRSRLYRKLLRMRDIIPGALSERKICCGRTNCICHREGKRHIAYQYSYKIGPKQVTRNIPREFVARLESQLQSNKEFKRTMKQIQEINLEILFSEIQDYRDKKKRKA
jgi:hypothetical protein